MTRTLRPGQLGKTCTVRSSQSGEAFGLLTSMRERIWGPGYVQLTVHNASQPPDLVIQVLNKRIAKCPDGSEKQILEKYYFDQTW